MDSTRTTPNTTTSTPADPQITLLITGYSPAILDGQINRIMSDRATTSTWGEAQTRRLDLLQRQRDRYEELYAKERDLLQ